MSTFDKSEYVGSTEFEALKAGLPYGQEFTFDYVSKAGRASVVRAVPLFPKVYYNLGSGEADELFAMLIINAKFVDGNGGGSGTPKKSASHDYAVGSMKNLQPYRDDEGEVYHRLTEDVLYPQRDYQIRCSALSVKRITAISGTEEAKKQASDPNWLPMAPVFLAGPRFVPVETEIYRR